VVQAEADPADDAPLRDRSEDGCFTRFVVGVVHFPELVIVATLGISAIIAIVTTALVYEKGSEVFADGNGQFDQGDDTFLLYRARDEATANLWPAEAGGCGGGGDFRRLAEDLIKYQGLQEEPGVDEPAPFGAGGMRSLLDGTASSVLRSAGFSKIETAVPPPTRPSLGARVPIAWGDTPDGIIWSDTPVHLKIQSDRRQMQGSDDFISSCADADALSDNAATSVGGCSHDSPCGCDPFSFGGCNTVCNITDSNCDPQQRQTRHRFMMVTEAVSPCDTEEPTHDSSTPPIECGEEGANHADCELKCSDGNSFTRTNLAEVRCAIASLENLVARVLATDDDPVHPSDQAPGGTRDRGPRVH